MGDAPRSDASAPSIVRPLVGWAAAVIVVAGLRASAAFLNPVLLAAFLALLLAPLVGWLVRHGWRRGVAVAVVFSGVLVVGLAVVGVTWASLSQLSGDLPTYADRLSGQVDALAGRLEDWGIPTGQATQLVDPGRILQVGVGLLGGAANALTATGLMLFVLAFFMADFAGFKRQARKALTAETASRLTDYQGVMIRYMGIRAGLGLAAAVADTVLLMVLGVDLALLWGVVAFALSFLPNVGFLLSMVFPAAMALLQFGPAQAGIVIAGYVVINTISDNVIAPRLIGDGVGLSTSMTFVSVLLWAWVLGGVGGLLAVPLTVFVQQVVMRAYADVRPWAAVLGGDT